MTTTGHTLLGLYLLKYVGYTCVDKALLPWYRKMYARYLRETNLIKFGLAAEGTQS